MARSKNAAALFEVISKDKKLDSKTTDTGGLRTPKWWFKGRSTPAATNIPMPTPERTISRPIADLNIPSYNIPGSSQPAGGERGAMTIRLNYHKAMLMACGIAVLVGGAYVIGKKMSRGPATVLGSAPIEEIKKGPIQAGVMELTGGEPDEIVEETIELLPRNSTLTTVPSTQNRPQTWNDPQPPAAVVVNDAKRNIGLNYVVVQSYADKKFAEEARDTLLANGVGCTIEQNLRGWSSRLHLVVGIDGFNRISSPEYKAYVKRLEVISNKTYPTNSYKAFQPIAYKWDR